MRKQQHLITREIFDLMLLYEVRQCLSLRRVASVDSCIYKNSSDPQHIARLVYRLVEWYKAWSPIPELVFSCISTLNPLTRRYRLGYTILSAYTLAFQTHVFSVLPPSFSRGFKALIASTFTLDHTSSPPPWIISTPPSPTSSSDSQQPPSRADLPLWFAFEQLGLLDRYESLISSVCYEYIEEHVVESCKGRWDEPMLKSLREWMTETIVPWMVMPYARGARNCALLSLIPVGACNFN